MQDDRNAAACADNRLQRDFGTLGDDQIDLCAHQVCRGDERPARIIHPPMLDNEILALAEATVAQLVQELLEEPGRRGRVEAGAEEPYSHGLAGLLRARRERPRGRAAEKRYELAPSQWIELHSVPAAKRDRRISNWR